MSDDQTTIQQPAAIAQTTTPVAATAGTGGVVVDPNKTAEQYIKEVEQSYIVPDLIREKFPDLVKLIYETESMNAEEREYWLQIMPIMSEQQVVKFRDILVNEKNQLSKLDADYEAEMKRINGEGTPKVISEDEVKAKMDQIRSQEAAQESSEKGAEENLLDALNQA